MPTAPQCDSEDLVVIADDKQGLEFRNYEAEFTVLDARHVTQAWLNDVFAGEHSQATVQAPGGNGSPAGPTSHRPGSRQTPKSAPRAEFDAQSRNDPPISDEDGRRRLQREIFAR
jgi:Restriction endonuclease AspBHI N-terminal